MEGLGVLPLHPDSWAVEESDRRKLDPSSNSFYKPLLEPLQRWKPVDNRHTHGHTGGEVGEGTDLNQSDTVYPGDKTPPGVWLTWICNNLSLRYINDIG